MLKKLMALSVLAVFAATGALYSAPSYATTGWYFVTACMVPNPMICPGGPLPFTYGPYATLTECSDAVYYASQSITGRYPRAASNCYQQ